MSLSSEAKISLTLSGVRETLDQLSQIETKLASLGSGGSGGGGSNLPTSTAALPSAGSGGAATARPASPSVSPTSLSTAGSLAGTEGVVDLIHAAVPASPSAPAASVSLPTTYDDKYTQMAARILAQRTPENLDAQAVAGIGSMQSLYHDMIARASRVTVPGSSVSLGGVMKAATVPVEDIEEHGVPFLTSLGRMPDNSTLTREVSRPFPRRRLGENSQVRHPLLRKFWEYAQASRVPFGAAPEAHVARAARRERYRSPSAEP